MSANTDIEIAQAILDNFPNNTSKFITPAKLRLVTNELNDSKVSRTGDLLIEAALGYTSVISLTDDKQLAHKKYVDDAVAGITPSPLTTKGDLYTFSTVNERLGVGANDTILTADSSAATGLAYKTIATILGYTPANNLLTGYTSGAGTVGSSDTILQAIQKLNGNDALAVKLAGTQTVTGVKTFNANVLFTDDKYLASSVETQNIIVLNDTTLRGADGIYIGSYNAVSIIGGDYAGGEYAGFETGTVEASMTTTSGGNFSSVGVAAGLVTLNIDDTTKLELSPGVITLSARLAFTGTDHAGIRLNSLTTTEQNALTAANGDIIYNSTTNKFRAYQNGSWTDVIGGGSGTVTEVFGTSNRISVSSGTSTPTIDIDAAYVGQASITTLGTIGTGTWNATAIADGKIASALTGKTYNGLTLTSTTGTFTLTNSKTLSVTNTLTLSGTDSTTITFQGTDTYVGRATTDTLTNKTLTAPTITSPTLTLASNATGDLYYNGGSGALTRLAAGAAGTLLMFNGTGAAPIVSTTVWPNAVTANRVLFATGTNTVGSAASLTYASSEMTISNASGNSGLTLASSTAASQMFMRAYATGVSFGLGTKSAFGSYTGLVLMSDANTQNGATANKISVRVGGYDTNQERMLVTTVGVSIGLAYDTNPSAQLHIVGAASTVGLRVAQTSGTANVLQIGDNSTGNLSYFDYLGGLKIGDTTEATNATTASVTMAGGLGVNKKLFVTGATTLSNLAGTGSRMVKASSVGLLSAVTYNKTLETFSADVTLTASTTTDFYSYTIPAGTLANDGDFIEFEYVVHLPNNSTTGSLGIIIGSGAVAFNAINLANSPHYRNLYLRVTRVSNTDAKCFWKYFNDTGAAVQGYILKTSLDLAASSYTVKGQYIDSDGVAATAKSGSVKLFSKEV